MQQLPLNIRPSFASSVRKYLVRWRQRTERHHRRELRACQREQLECELEEMEENQLMDQVMKEVVLENGGGEGEGGGEGSGGGEGGGKSGGELFGASSGTSLQAASETLEWLDAMMSVENGEKSGITELLPCCDAMFLDHEFFPMYYKNQRSNIVGFPTLVGGMNYSSDPHGAAARKCAPVRIRVSITAKRAPMQTIVVARIVNVWDRPKEQDSLFLGTTMNRGEVDPSSCTYAKLRSSSDEVPTIAASSSSSSGETQLQEQQFVYDAEMNNGRWPYTSKQNNRGAKSVSALLVLIYCSSVSRSDSLVCVETLRSTPFSVQSTQHLRRKGRSTHGKESNKESMSGSGGSSPVGSSSLMAVAVVAERPAKRIKTADKVRESGEVGGLGLHVGEL